MALEVQEHQTRYRMAGSLRERESLPSQTQKEAVMQNKAQALGNLHSGLEGHYTRREGCIAFIAWQRT